MKAEIMDAPRIIAASPRESRSAVNGTRAAGMPDQIMQHAMQVVPAIWCAPGKDGKADLMDAMANIAAYHREPQIAGAAGERLTPSAQIGLEYSSSGPMNSSSCRVQGSCFSGQS